MAPTKETRKRVEKEAFSKMMDTIQRNQVFLKMAGVQLMESEDIHKPDIRIIHGMLLNTLDGSLPALCEWLFSSARLLLQHHPNFSATASFTVRVDDVPTHMDNVCYEDAPTRLALLLSSAGWNPRLVFDLYVESGFHFDEEKKKRNVRARKKASYRLRKKLEKRGKEQTEEEKDENKENGGAEGEEGEQSPTFYELGAHVVEERIGFLPCSLPSSGAMQTVRIKQATVKDLKAMPALCSRWLSEASALSKSSPSFRLTVSFSITLAEGYGRLPARIDCEKLPVDKVADHLTDALNQAGWSVCSSAFDVLFECEFLPVSVCVERERQEAAMPAGFAAAMRRMQRMQLLNTF